MHPPRVVEWLLPFFRGLSMGLAAMFLHEAAHLLAAVALGVRVKRVGIRWNKGLFTVRDAGSPGKNVLISLAGPLMNLLLVSFSPWSRLFGLANFCCAFGNLIPIEGSDGLRVLQCWMQLRKKGGAA